MDTFGPRCVTDPGTITYKHQVHDEQKETCYTRNKKLKLWRVRCVKSFIRLFWERAVKQSGGHKLQKTTQKGDCRHAPDAQTLDHAGSILGTKIPAVKRWTSAGQPTNQLVPLDVQERFGKSPKVKSTRRNGVWEQLPLQFGSSAPRFYSNIYNSLIWRQLRILTLVWCSDLVLQRLQ